MGIGVESEKSWRRVGELRRRGENRRNRRAAMRPLYDARIEDLSDGDFLRVECAACVLTS